MERKDVSITRTLIVILASLLFVTLLANFGVSLNPEYYKSDTANTYERWVSTSNLD